MTMPIERTRAVVNTRAFLRSLLDPKLTPRIPKKIRTEAYYLLKHYPWTMYLDEVSEKCPEIFGKVGGEDNE